MTTNDLETVARALGIVAYGIALSIGGLGALRGRRHPSSIGAGVAARRGALPAYLLTAIPYYLVCAALWRPLPVEPSTGGQVVALMVAVVLGPAGFALYVSAHIALGSSYDVSGGLGTVVHDDAALVTTGPYAIVRHPMYLGVTLGAVAGLLLYRTWTFVWVLASLVAIARKARIEDSLLAERFRDDFAKYRADVPGWIPRLRRRPRAGATRAWPASSG